jgi:hypothetical protein
MFGSLQRWLERGRDDVARRVEEMGLKSGAKLAARTLGEPLDDDRLHPWQLETLAAFLDRLTHDPDADLPRASDIGAAQTCAEFISKLPASRIAQISHVLAVFEAGSMVLSGDFERERFTALPDDARDRYIEGWASSPLPQRRTIFAALKSIGGIGYWSQDATWPAIGYSIDENPGVPDHARSDDGTEG